MNNLLWRAVRRGVCWVQRMVRPRVPEYLTDEGKELWRRGYRGHEQTITNEMRRAYGIPPKGENQC